MTSVPYIKAKLAGIFKELVTQYPYHEDHLKRQYANILDELDELIKAGVDILRINTIIFSKISSLRLYDHPKFGVGYGGRLVLKEYHNYRDVAGEIDQGLSARQYALLSNR